MYLYTIYHTRTMVSLYDAAGEMQSKSTSATFGINYNNELYYRIPSFWLISYTHIPIPSPYTPPQLSNRVDKPAIQHRGRLRSDHPHHSNLNQQIYIQTIKYHQKWPVTPNLKTRSR
jgi:hypothetical protein